MFALIRKHQYALFCLVAILGIAFFVFPDSRSRSGVGGAGGRSLNVLGAKFSAEEVKNIKQSLGILDSLRNRNGDQFSQFNDPVYQHIIRAYSVASRTQQTNPDDENAPPDDFTINTALVRVLARQLGLNASEAEIEKRLQSLPSFQVEGKFSPSMWKSYIDTVGGEAGARRKAIYTALADTILFDKLVALVGEKIPASPVAVDLAYNRQHEQLTTSVVTLEKKEFENQEVTEEELKAWYDQHQDDASLKTEEKRGIVYTLISKATPEELKDLDDAKKTEKEKEYRKRAAAFSEQLVAEDRGDKTFAQIAAELNLEVKTPEPFTQKAPPEELKSKFQVLRLAFGLPEKGRSDLVEIPGEGYYAVELASIEEPKPLSFEEAKETITATVKQEKQDKAFAEHVKSLREKILAGLEAGKSFAEAAQEADAPAPRDLPTFSQRKPLPNEPAAFDIQQAAAKTDIGAVSEPVTPRAGDTSLLVYVSNKELPKDPKMEDDKKNLAAQQSFSAAQQPSSNPVFAAWFNKKRDETDAGLNKR